MIWHIVRFDFTGVPASMRTSIEDQLAGLDAIDEVAWLRVARDVADPDVTGLITVFRSEEDLDAYRTHPDHLPVVEAIRAAGVPAARLDVETPDEPADLP